VSLLLPLLPFLGYVSSLWGAYDSRFTKLPELTFHAVVGDKAREIRFKHLLVR
jgi:hypothetical protein